MVEYNLRAFEITKERVIDIINDLYYSIGYLLSTQDLREDQREILCCALDEQVNGAKGIMLLLTDLMGDNLSVIENPTTGEFRCVKKAGEDPEVIYEQINELIREINAVLDTELVYA